jgi:hypothetical protein
MRDPCRRLVQVLKWFLDGSFDATVLSDGEAAMGIRRIERNEP